MIVIFETQRYENYGGEHASYWKPKGGRTIKVVGVPNDLDDGAIADLYSVMEINTSTITDNVSYHVKYDENAPVYDWEQVIDYADLINLKIQESA
jgi:hypothetical protein